MDLQKIAEQLQADLAANRREAINDLNAADVQALSFAEEAASALYPNAIERNIVAVLEKRGILKGAEVA